MDAYEVYYDEYIEYIEFMKLYKTKTELDPADRAYYAEVSSRISEKLIASLE